MASVITRQEKGLPLSTVEMDENLSSLEFDVNLSVRNSNNWVALSVVNIGDVLKHDVNYYLVTASGTTSNTAPIHNTGSSVNGTATLEYFQPSAYTHKDVLDKLLRVDGPNSGLDADVLDGLQPSSILPITVNKSSVVSRDASGNFSANVITANVTGNLNGNANSSTLSTNTAQLNGKTEAQLREEILDEIISITIALG